MKPKHRRRDEFSLYWQTQGQHLSAEKYAGTDAENFRGIYAFGALFWHDKRCQERHGNGYWVCWHNKGAVLLITGWDSPQRTAQSRNPANDLQKDHKGPHRATKNLCDMKG